MVHGGSQTGTNFTGTPDGREGWAQYFVRRGYAVYVVDQVARGRAAHWSQIARAGAAARNVDRLDAALRRAGALQAMAAGASAHAMAGSGQAGRSVVRSVLRLAISLDRELPEAAGDQPPMRWSALLDKIGPAILLTHSQSGAFGWPVADARPNLVKAMVAVEPSGPPVHDVENTGAPDWFKDAERDEALGPQRCSAQL